eukprot:907008_1
MTSFLSRVIQDAMDAIILPLGSTDHQQTATWNTIYVIVCGLYLLSCGAMVAELGLGIHAKYGRFAPLNSFCAIPAHIAWCLQELPSFAFASYFLIQSFQERLKWCRLQIACYSFCLLFITQTEHSFIPSIFVVVKRHLSWNLYWLCWLLQVMALYKDCVSRDTKDI